jgi:hypothetical protein
MSNEPTINWDEVLKKEARGKNDETWMKCRRSETHMYQFNPVRRLGFRSKKNVTRQPFDF